MVLVIVWPLQLLDPFTLGAMAKAEDLDMAIQLEKMLPPK